MGYVTNRDGRWYAVSYEGLDPLTGRDRRRREGSPCRDTCAPDGSPPARIGFDRQQPSGTSR